MFPFLIKTKEVILDIFFPPLCLNCQKHLATQTYTDLTRTDADTNSKSALISQHPHPPAIGFASGEWRAGKSAFNFNQYICAECLSLIKLNNTLFCPVCRARLADNKRWCPCHIKNEIILPNGDKKVQKFSYLLAAAGNYDDPILQNLIHYFKYKSFKNLAPVLGEILTKYLENLSLSIVKSQRSIVIPIPLHPQRERQRGFNQAKLIAEIMAKSFDLELFDGLKRVKNNKPQVGLRDSEARIKNMAGCFEIQNPERVKDKNILLVDDVLTSGATINEAVKVLKANGAKRIIALVVAKA